MYFERLRRLQQSLSRRTSGSPTDAHVRRSGGSPSDAEATSSPSCRAVATRLLRTGPER